MKVQTRIAGLSAWVLLAALPMILVACVVYRVGHERVSPLEVPETTERDLPLAACPDPTSLGIIECGQPAECQLSLRNATPRRIKIDRIETGCPCVVVSPVPATVEPSGSVLLLIAFDPTHEPDFLGKLSVNVTGYSDSESVFRTHVILEVRPQSR